LLRDDVQLRADATRLILRLCQQMGCVEGLSGVLRVPAVAFLERTGGELDHLPPLFDERASATAIGDLTSGAIIHAAVCDPLDVRAVEWLMDTGARVHATIADEMAEFRIHFARRFDEIQAQRMVGVLERCASVTVGRGLLADEFDWRRRQTTSQALGRSIADARRTAGSWHLLRLRQTERGGWIDRGDWLDNVDAQPQTPLSRINLDRLTTTPAVLGKRRIVGLLFADFVGFRRLGDDVMQQFWQEMFVAIGELMEPHAARILLGKTWGDGLHIVTTDASTVAAIAVAIQRYIAQRRADAADALAGLEMRIAVHYAPVFCDLDPVSKSSAFLGTQLTFAARIEPVTPPGTIYATEAITAQLALESPNEYLLEYAGRIELAKNFGQHRLYCLTDAARH